MRDLESLDKGQEVEATNYLWGSHPRDLIQVTVGLEDIAAANTEPQEQPNGWNFRIKRNTCL